MTELFSFEISLLLLLSIEEEKPLSVKFQNGRIVLNTIKKPKDQLMFQDIYSLLKFSKLKFVTRQMYSELTSMTLDRNIFIIR